MKDTFYLRLKKNDFDDFKLNPGLKKKMVLFGKCFVKAGGGGLALAKRSAKSTTFFGRRP